ncbi:FecR family protein [Ohtaekwangia koreensis]|uniref:FecR family protein n=1 Tax=Ohtaekwangia koreensis TaxID=688867 RepID=A0A1T5J6J8_9BACT|nr:FecR domain-containing protein [Ohtaekwangia koreensis]SKC46853.1 FecR family protein [Ohtaekwangia koreensis]
MAADKEDIDFERKIHEMEIPLKNFISEEEKETSWKEILLTVEGDTRKKSIAHNFYWAAAASVLVIIGIVVWSTMNSGYKTSDHEKLNIGLSDGSSVTLNYKSTLELADDFGKESRHVSLQGEAFFNVQKDKSKPFVITIGEYEVMVVGTSFNINYKKKFAEVTVCSGIVRLHAGNQFLNLKAGEKGIISSAGKLSVEEWDANDFAWYSGTLVLKDKSLQKVAAILSKLFNKTVEVSPSVASCTLSAKIEYETIDDILVIIKETLGVEWKNDSHKVYIYGKGC